MTQIPHDPVMKKNRISHFPLNSSNVRVTGSLALALAVAGCGTVDPRIRNRSEREKGPDGTVAYHVKVESSEPGVRIEADGDFVGTTPLALKIFGDKDGTFHAFGRPDYTIRAIPNKPGQYVQIKTYGTGAWFGREDRIPSAVYFDMNLAPAGTGTNPSDGTGAAPVRPSSPSLEGSATAFAITSDGYLISNHHVIEGAKRVTVLMPDGSEEEVKVVAKDLRNDLAVLKISKSVIPLRLADSGDAKLGESVCTLGYPRSDLQGQNVKFATGTIGGLTGLEDDVAQFQIDVPVQPGNSGSPLIDGYGEVIGVVKATLNPLKTLAQDGSLPQSVNYAVKSAYLNLLLQTVPGIREKLPVSKERTKKAFDQWTAELAPSVFLVRVYQ